MGESRSTQVHTYARRHDHTSRLLFFRRETRSPARDDRSGARHREVFTRRLSLMRYALRSQRRPSAFLQGVPRSGQHSPRGSASGSGLMSGSALSFRVPTALGVFLRERPEGPPLASPSPRRIERSRRVPFLALLPVSVRANLPTSLAPLRPLSDDDVEQGGGGGNRLWLLLGVEGSSGKTGISGLGDVSLEGSVVAVVP